MRVSLLTLLLLAGGAPRCQPLGELRPEWSGDSKQGDVNRGGLRDCHLLLLFQVCGQLADVISRQKVRVQVGVNQEQDGRPILDNLDPVRQPA